MLLLDVTINPTSYVQKPYWTTTICVNILPGIATVTGPKDLPEVNLFPKVATIPPFCLKPKIFPFHPSP